MSIYSIDAALFARMFFAGARNLELNKAWINDLNVFPVPDGDTGTNMTMTLSSAVKEMQGVREITMDNMARAMSFGSLRGARGNSGVIMSQLLRGFCKALADKTELDAVGVAEAAGRAVETAYKAVMKPKEGTILTVARGIADKWAELAADDSDLERLLEQTLEHGDAVLAHTPELLPVLKEAGVVDSGGQGLMVFLRGAQAAMLGKDAALAMPEQAPAAPAERETPLFTEKLSTDDIKFGYCTEFLVNVPAPLTEAQEEEFRSYLENLGDSIVMVAMDEIVKVHVHTNDPGLAIQKALSFGPLTNMKIDNMRVEHEEKLIRNASAIAAQEKAQKEQLKPVTPDKSSWKSVGVVATAVGEGLKELFKSVGVDAIVEGGQTMNPSAADILEAVEKVPAHTVFVLPNNGNIILAARQAESMSEDRRLIVIPTTSVPQGITVMTNFIPDASAQANEKSMLDSLGSVRCGEVTYAVRDTTIGGHEIHEKDIMALGGKDGIYAVGHDIAAVTEEMIAAMMSEDAGLISLYYGAGVSEEEAEALQQRLAARYPDQDVDVLYGGQPVYYYLGSVE